MADSPRIQWLLVILSALLIEFVLTLVLVPVQLVFGDQAFLVAVPVGITVIPFVLTLWISRRVRERVALHGLLIGVVATLVYLGLVVSGGALASTIETYGVFMFILDNGLRIVATVTGAIVEGRRRSDSSAAAEAGDQR